MSTILFNPNGEVSVFRVSCNVRFGKEFEITVNEGANICTSFTFSIPRIIFQLVQFEMTSAHHFIKIKIMLQHTNSYMFRASMLHHQGAQMPETSQCVIYVCRPSCALSTVIGAARCSEYCIQCTTLSLSITYRYVAC
jgi:hypothetical protein